jgi:signal transduction histidine kinase
LSESYHKKGFLLAKKIDFKIEIARQASNLSSVSLLKNNYEKAIKFSKLSYDLSLEICQFEIAACSSLNLGSGYFLAKKYDKSLLFYNISLRLIKQVNQLFLFPPIYKALMDYFYHFKNYKKAFFYQKLYNEFSKKFEGVIQKERILGLELKYSLVEKNNEILQLTAENQANVLKINEVLQQHENEKRNQANRIELQLREELAHKLHNNVASTLVSTKMYLEELTQSGRLSSVEKKYATKALTQLNATYKDMRQLAQEIKEIDHRDLKKELSQLIALYSSLPNLTFKSQVNIATPVEGDFVIDTLGIIKELMTNALKHSMANQFILKVDVNSKRLSLVFKFNGEKFDGTNADKQSSGYQSIRNYLLKYNGAIKHATNSLFSIIEIKTSIKDVKTLS